MRGHRKACADQAGFTLVEVLVSLTIAVVLLVSLTGVVNHALGVQDATRGQNEATRQARFALDRMVAAARRSDRLLLPLADNPATNWREHVREQSVPATAPEGDSSFATAVLAVTLGPTLDRDEDGWADANNDRDFVDLNKNFFRDAGEPERVDEDPSGDLTHDDAPGIFGIDDDGDGDVDESLSGSGTDRDDDDEDGFANDDPWDGLDNDGDGSIDEDPDEDLSADGRSGLVGVDDDGDDFVDESNADNDDEDSLNDEDWLDPVVFFLSGSTLIERIPHLDPSDGRDFTEYPIADSVSYFGVERIAGAGNRDVVVEITLHMIAADAAIVQLTTKVRVGGGL